MVSRTCAGALVALALAACSASPPLRPDAGPPDAGSLDAGSTDAGALDGGVDAGAPDAGLADAGSDAGLEDAGPADAGAPDAGLSCEPGGDGGYRVTPYSSLSSYCLVWQHDGGIAFDPSVIPYALNTPLFSDGAVKVRGAWMPAGGQATYAEDGGSAAFDFPVGSILIKSFGFRDDYRLLQPHLTWVETRLLIRGGDGTWKGYDYLWNDGGADATLSYSGATVPLAWIGEDGGPASTNYPVPSFSQCKQCHAQLAIELPLGPKGRNFNGAFPYPGGAENQLSYWTDAGDLLGAPVDPAAAPRLPVWNDPSTGSLEERARAYLEVNCAHCHSSGGYARTTGLFLWAAEGNPSTYGICKPPVAAGPATGGFQYDIVPGDPDHSILMYRIQSTTPDIMMPLIGRSIVDEAGVQLVHDWIASLDGGCP